MMRQFGLKVLLVLSGLMLAWPPSLPAQANGGGSAGTGSTEEDDAAKAGDQNDATGSIGGTAPKPEGSSGSTGTDVTSPGALIPGDGSRLGNPCPIGYLLSEDGHMCARP